MYLLKPLHKLPSLRGEEEVERERERERERGREIDFTEEEIVGKHAIRDSMYLIRNSILKGHWIV